MIEQLQLNEWRQFDNLTIDFDKRLTILTGANGSGKTTILNILGGMDKASSGKVVIDNNDVAKYNSRKLTDYRRYDIGFVFQFYNLVGNLTALENVSLASQICKHPMDSEEALKRVGLLDRKDHFPAQLSGGEQQRVSIARAIAKNPKLLLCDEPTGALDSKTGKKIIELLQDTCHKTKTTTIIITHNAVIADIADKVIRVKNGKIESVTVNKKPKLVKEIDW